MCQGKKGHLQNFLHEVGERTEKGEMWVRSGRYYKGEREVGSTHMQHTAVTYPMVARKGGFWC